eukprot:gb/GEZN01018919.1/.p1 GENE.gb/GEZN01018919.1/~~gb/GEZN01018919.1/.p1  ORF type:complete len:227 (-),score=45.55 gb/GEZN01018919.1/:15-695(-)
MQPNTTVKTKMKKSNSERKAYLPRDPSLLGDYEKIIAEKENSIFDDAVALDYSPHEVTKRLKQQLVLMESKIQDQSQEVAALRKLLATQAEENKQLLNESQLSTAQAIKSLTGEISKLLLAQQEKFSEELTEKLEAQALEFEEQLKSIVTQTAKSVKQSAATEKSREAFEKKISKALARKVGLNEIFVIRTLNSTAVMAHQRFWKGEKMVIDRFENASAADPEDWR